MAGGLNIFYSPLVEVHKMKNELFSVVIPVYNEDESLKELLKSLKSAFTIFKKKYEIIFVDDGSTDRTLEVLQILTRGNRNIKVYSFRKNLGKSYAFMLGFEKAKGKYIITLDADLQDDPKNIKTLYQKLKDGNFDIVTGWRKDRKDSFAKKFMSDFVNQVVVPFLFGINLHDLNSGLQLYKAEVAKDLKIYGGMHKFMPLIASETGYKVAEKEILNHPRKYGRSKYKASAIFSEIPDLLTIYFLTQYTRRPINFFGKVGISVLFVGILIIFYAFINSAERHVTTFIMGALFVILGVITSLAGLTIDLLVNFQSKDNTDLPLKYESS